MKFAFAVAVLVCLSACNRGSQSKDAVRQGVIDHLAGVGMNVAQMNVEVTALQFNGDHADATVAITPKGNGGAGMSMGYQLQQQGTKWVVVGRKDTGASPHGGGAVPAAGAPASPHGGAMPPAGSDKMPSPSELPPVKK